MNMKKIIFAAGGLMFAFAVVFNACGGGGGSNGLAGRNTSKGIITGFGSVFVNGVEFDTSNAAVTIDDNPSSEADLRLGMEVTVKSDGTAASSITAADDLEGPISSVDAAAGSVNVMGQTVQVDGLTRFEGASGLAALAAGNIIEVSGLADSAGVIHATRIEMKSSLSADPSRSIEVKGIVKNLDAGSDTFTLNALIVQYADAEANGRMKDFPAGGMAEGQFVEVKATLGDLTGNVLIAESVELEPGLDADENEHVEVEGFITDFVSNGNFKVNGVTVDASALNLTGLANDVEVEIEGTMNADGVLVAGKGELEDESEGPDDNSGH